MKPGWRTARYVAGLVMACLFSASSLNSQTRPTGQAGEQKPQLAEEAFTNIQVLRGIPVKEFMETMGFFAASLSLNCTDCHGDARGAGRPRVIFRRARVPSRERRARCPFAPPRSVESIGQCSAAAACPRRSTSCVPLPGRSL